MESSLSEAEVDLIVYDKLKEKGWKTNETVSYQHTFAPGKIFPSEDYKFGRGEPFRPEYVLYYKPEGKNVEKRPVAVIEDKPVSTRKLGVGAEQVKDYASLLGVKFAYVANDKDVIEYDMITGKESAPYPLEFPTPEELWEKSQRKAPIKEENYSTVFQPYNRVLKNTDLTVKVPRYYQERAINAAIDAIALSVAFATNGTVRDALGLTSIK